MPWAARRSSTPGVRHVVFRKVGAGSRSVRNPSGPSPPTAELAKEAWISTSVAEDTGRLSLGPRPGKSLGKLPQRERSSRRHQMKYQIPTLRTGTSLARSTLRNSMYRLILSMPPGRLMRAAIFPAHRRFNENLHLHKANRTLRQPGEVACPPLSPSACQP